MSELLLITKPQHDLFPTLSLHGFLITEVRPLCNRPSVLVHTNSCSTPLPAHQVNKWLWPRLQTGFQVKTGGCGGIGSGVSDDGDNYVQRHMHPAGGRWWRKNKQMSTFLQNPYINAQMADRFRSYRSAVAPTADKQACDLLLCCFQDEQWSRWGPNEHMVLAWGSPRRPGPGSALDSSHGGALL